METYADRCLVDYGCHLLNACEKGVCMHKEVWPLTLLDGSLWLCIVALSALATAAGVTERVVLVPLIIWLGGFSAHQTLPIVNLVICGSLTIVLAYQHSTRSAPVEYRLVLFLSGPLLLGTSFGLVANAMLPEPLLLCLLLLALAFDAVRIFQQ